MVATTVDRGFGRIEAHGVGDDKDDQFPLRAAIPRAVALPRTRYWSFFYKALDQGSTGTCVGHGGKDWMLAGPVTQTKPFTPPTAIDLYVECTKVDEWPQNDNGDLNFGTSVRALFKVLQARGLVAEYRWAQSLADVQEFVSLVSPLVIGVNWYDGMMFTDKDGFIHPTGGIAGGHCVIIIGVDNVKRRFRILNSWGPGWGQSGRAWVSFEDMERLIFAEGGEAAAGLETRLAA